MSSDGRTECTRQATASWIDRVAVSKLKEPFKIFWISLLSRIIFLKSMKATEVQAIGRYLLAAFLAL
ncbi:unnamed protein product, partial [Dicrocoelium dendriticum]